MSTNIDESTKKKRRKTYVHCSLFYIPKVILKEVIQKYISSGRDKLFCDGMSKKCLNKQMGQKGAS